MTGEQEREIRWQQMASLGRLLADFSHEMRNHLAVIQEANGLLEDILALQGEEGSPLSSSVRQTAAQIGKRVRTSAELCRHLSSMAHRSDTPRSFFQVNDLLIDLAVFLDRSTRSQQITLQFEPGQGVEPLYNEPALLQYILYQLYVFSLQQLGQGDTLLVRTAQVENGVAIDFYLPGVPQATLAGISETVWAALASLEAKLEELKNIGDGLADSAGLRLLLPSLPAI
ncbi:MAG: hypothetical protein Q3M24_22255 [Candidatus Electrothrix aestuarii]|uniref:His Kinase A (Phospho-acceptor) domain-containing protein n=1 Tax=Candidatus Electrothrix aestuarii TaxID=3062594 RepID=A0AAU8LTW5_9BACT|nr:hypothetical protein [Candidatus Electrothrix aestuarii]